jgi:predicted N-formylglutamate amidohydrolase
VSARRAAPAGRRSTTSPVFLVTCEHGGNRVPIAYQDLFRRAGPALASHRGWDAGTVALARDLARDLAGMGPGEGVTSPRVATVTRLLVDLNRSAHNPRVFSQWTRSLPLTERRILLERYHTPHREAVASDVAELVARDRRVIHLAAHSFTPVVNGRMRRVDLALLYDPARLEERTLAATWVQVLRRRLPELRVGRNQPYKGASDGLTTWLRRRHGDGRYLGIEIEVSQRLLDAGGRLPREVTEALAEGAIEAATFPRAAGTRHRRR